MAARIVAPTDTKSTRANRALGPHKIVFANEKGGVGKSTTAFHVCAALCNKGAKVLAVDLDSKQQSLGKALANREGMARRMNIAFPQPRHSVLGHCTAAGLDQEINRLGFHFDFAIIDVAGHDSAMARHAIALADTLVTPINDSFVDLDLLGHFDPVKFSYKEPGHFSRLVAELKDKRPYPLDWIVVPNRLRRLGTANEKRIDHALQQVAPKAGFRIAPGVGERVIYRDLFPFGLTLFDLHMLPNLARAQPKAKAEMEAMLNALNLPLILNRNSA